MAKFEIVVENPKEIFVKRTDGTKQARDSVTEKELLKTAEWKFTLLYNSQNRLCGYRFETLKNYLSKFVVNNGCFFVFSKVNDVKRTIDIRYEDQAVRLLAFEAPGEVSDIWLIGRWRATDD